MPDQLVLIQNFQSKIANYQTALGLTAAQVTAAAALCAGYIEAFSLTEQCRATMKAQIQWRDMAFYGTPKGGTLPDSPVFPTNVAPLHTKGVVTQFFELRDQIVNAPGYTDAIGQDLGIVGHSIQPTPPLEVKPSLKPSVSFGNWVNFSGCMQGMSGLRIEYAPKGGEFRTVGFLTNTPGSVQITTTQPEAGQLRAIFIKKNEDYGNYSDNYPVVLA
jgi:hypothetical protein